VADKQWRGGRAWTKAWPSLEGRWPGIIEGVGNFLRAEIAAGRPVPAGGDRVLRGVPEPFAEVRVLVVGQDFRNPGPGTSRWA